MTGEPLGDLSDLDQTYSDADQRTSDSDQAGANADRDASEVEQHAAERDQAAADRDEAQTRLDAASERAYAASRAERIAAAAGRLHVAGERAESTQTRAAVAGARAEQTSRREEAAFEHEVRRRTFLRLESERALLAWAEELAEAGSWVHDPRAGFLTWSPGMYRIRGREPGAGPISVESATVDVHPDDRDRVVAEYTRVDPAEGDLRSTHRIVCPDGAVRHLETRLRVARDDAGAALRIVGVSVDVTTRHEHERQLARSRKLLERSELILNAAGEGICGVDRAGVVVFANPRAARLTGYEPAGLVGRVLHDALHHSKADGSPYPIAECPVTTSLVDGAVRHGDDDVYWRKDGSRFPVEYTSTPVLEDGRVTGAVVVFTDITERRAVETALAASERWTRQIVDTAQDAFVSIDAGGLIVDWNAQAQAVFGWSREEAMGRSFAATLLPEREREAYGQRQHGLLATAEAPDHGERLELRALHREGHEFPVELTVTAAQMGGANFFNAFVRDITARKAAEDMLERQRQQLIEAQSVGGFGSWEWDLASDTVEWSDELCRIYGVEPTGHPRNLAQVIDATHPDYRGRLQAHVQASLESGEPMSFESRIVRSDGTVRFTHARGRVVKNGQGTPVRMVGTAQDITERHALERKKDEFISVVSHELRTPLTSIRASLGLLASGVLGQLPEQGQRMVEIAVANTDRLVRLISDILDIERIDSAEVEMRSVSCDARELIERAVEALASIAAAAGVSVASDAEPVRLSADPDRVIQTLTNLIANAVKFAPPSSSVRVSCRRRDREALFEVSDEGRGIPVEHRESVFGRFQQIDASDSRRSGGTGLGLAICRGIVEQHGGRIWAQGNEGPGVTLCFTLPAPLT